jgi:hypothetical protein
MDFSKLLWVRMPSMGEVGCPGALGMLVLLSWYFRERVKENVE